MHVIITSFKSIKCKFRNDLQPEEKCLAASQMKSNKASSSNPGQLDDIIILKPPGCY